MIIRKKDIIILGESPTQGLEHTLTAGKSYSTNFTENNKKFCLSLHYNGANSYLFVNGTEIIKLKVEESEIVAYLSCLQKDFMFKRLSCRYMKNTGLNGYVYDFSVDCDAVAVDDIFDIHKYLMKKHDIK